MSDQELMQLAENVRKNANFPYSKFKVGAALLSRYRSIYTGCNKENSSYGASMCAERAAISQAVADGKRKFVKIAVCGGKDNTETPCPPCGICRQVLREFCEDNFRVVMKNGNSLFSDTIGDLLPLCFQKSLLDL